MKAKLKYNVLDEFYLKVTALVVMLIDHVASFFQSTYMGWPNGVELPILETLRNVGRLAFPLFVFMLVESMRKSHHRGKYIFHLFLIWIPTFVFDLVLWIKGTSILSVAEGSAFTDLLLYAIFIYFFEKRGWKKLLCLLPVAFIAACTARDTCAAMEYYGMGNFVWIKYFPSWLCSWYEIYGFLIFLAFYFAYPLLNKIIQKKFGAKLEAEGLTLEEYQKTTDYQGYADIIAAIGFAIVNIVIFIVGINSKVYDFNINVKSEIYAIFAIIPILLYNGKRGYDKKWFRWTEYLFYPVHIFILCFFYYFVVYYSYFFGA